LREEGYGDTAQDEACKDGDGKDILVDLLISHGFGKVENDVLNLVVYPPARLEGL
jgi:hypothetical protein